MRSFRWLTSSAAAACILLAALSGAAVAANDEPQQEEISPAPPAATAPADQDQNAEKRKPRLTFSPNLDVFMPSDSDLKEYLGDTWTGLGFSFDYRGRYKQFEGYRLRITGVMRESGDDHAYIFPVGVCYTQNLKSHGQMDPYIGASANLNIVDLKINEINVDSGLKVTPGLCVLAGTTVGSHLTLEACHYLSADVDGVGIGGTNLSLRLKF